MLDKYILRWWDGDGCTYNFEVIQPFETDDINSWEYNLLLCIEDAKKNDDFDFEYDKIKLPVTSSEFGYVIMSLNDWFIKNLNK